LQTGQGPEPKIKDRTRKFKNKGSKGPYNKNLTPEKIKKRHDPFTDYAFLLLYPF
jgi:hypothetical protein